MRRVPLLLALPALLFLSSGCGGDDNKKGEPSQSRACKEKLFHTRAAANTFAGPAPLTVAFSVTPRGACGDVYYRWAFDDGTTSEEAEPVHVFKRPGSYQVLMDARDSKRSDRWNLVVSAWPKEVWEGTVSSRQSVRKVRADQGNLTADRRQEQLVASKRRARRSLQLP